MPQATKLAIAAVLGWLVIGCSLLSRSGSSAPLAVADTEGSAAHRISADFERQILVTIVNPPQLDLRRAGSTIRGYFSPGTYRASPAARQVAEQLGREYGLTRRDAWPIRALQVHCVVYEVPAGLSRDTAIAALAQDPRVESVQPMQSFSVLGSEHEDPYSGFQHSIMALSVSGAHRWARGRGVRVGVIDTGVDVRHRELTGKVVATGDFAGRDRGAFSTDRHGTAMAGVIAASVNNRLGIVGIAPEAALIAAKACWYERDSGVQATAVCSSFTLARALAFALERKVDVLNLSLTGPRDALLERLVAAALRSGVVVVAAQPAGARTAAFPAGVHGVIAVLAAEIEDVTQHAEGALYAPGREILTLTPDDRYGYFSGSSVAAAHVSGIAALMRELRPGMSSEAVRDILVDTSAQLRFGPRTPPTLVNACAALAHVIGNSECPAALDGASAYLHPDAALRR